MGRAGRKRKTNVVRDASGKSRGEVFDPSVIFSQPHRRETTLLLVSQRKDPIEFMNEAGHTLGRLRISGLITKTQSRAGSVYASVVRSYARMNGIPMGSPKSGSMSEFIGGGFYQWEGEEVFLDGESQVEADKRKARVREQYNDCHETLADLGRMHNRGRKILFVMREVCIQEAEEKGLWADPDKIGDLRLGLNAVHKVLFDQRERR